MQDSIWIAKYDSPTHLWLAGSLSQSRFLGSTT